MLSPIATETGDALKVGRMVDSPRVVLADDQPEILAAVSYLLQNDYDVVAAVPDGMSVIEAVARLDPDLLVLDISMPILDGLKAAARLQASASRAKVLFLTVHNDPDYVEAAFAVGARGYVLKPRLGSDLRPALREVWQGRTFVSPPLNGHNRP